MNELHEYKDPVTGYSIRQYTVGPKWNRKLYFTTENFTADDRYLLFNREDDGLYRADVHTGELEKLADAKEYSRFAMDRVGNWGVMAKNGDTICKLDLNTCEITELGHLPRGGRLTEHLTTADTGRVACSYQLANKIFSLCILDPGKTEAEVVHMSDYHLSHGQICPTDENIIFYVHETGGDALQRTWMYDIKEGRTKPYYVEKLGDWITHEVWRWDGREMAIMRMPDILVGDKDGHCFRLEAHCDRVLHHPCISRDGKYICADTMNDGNGPSVELFERSTGKHWTLAVANMYKTGEDHLHPSFNRKGDKIIFNAPDKNGNAQVCVIDIAGIIE